MKILNNGILDSYNTTRMTYICYLLITIKEPYFKKANKTHQNPCKSEKRAKKENTLKDTFENRTYKQLTAHNDWRTEVQIKKIGHEGSAEGKVVLHLEAHSGGQRVVRLSSWSLHP